MVELPILTPAPLQLWLVDLAAAAGALEAVDARLGLLDDAERGRLGTISNPEVRTERLAAHRALRVALEVYAGPAARAASFTRSPLGRPVAAGLDCDFSLSHAGGYALLGVRGGGTIGVDIERQRGVDFPPARKARVLQGAVVLAGRPLIGAGDEPRLIAAWTRLEAYAKADGCGMARVLGRIGAVGPRADSQEPGTAHPRDDARRVTVLDVAAPPGYAAAVCLMDASPAIPLAPGPSFDRPAPVCNLAGPALLRPCAFPTEASEISRMLDGPSASAVR